MRTGLGGGGPLVYKRTRRGDRAVDAAAGHVVRRRGGEVRGATSINTEPFGEPRPGKRGLYPSVGGPAAEDAVLAAADRLLGAGLLVDASPARS